jgi:hypothetical protein
MSPIVKIISLYLLSWIVRSKALTQLNTTATSSWVIFQAFDWNSLSDRSTLYTKIQGMAPSLKSAGINAVWFPPPSQSIDPQGYLPQQVKCAWDGFLDRV